MGAAQPRAVAPPVEVVGGGGHRYHPRAGVVRGARRVWEDLLLEINVEQTERYTLCRPVGELDAYTVAQFRDALSELASAERLLIDLSDVPFMDSSGLGALIGGIRRAREADGDVTVACSRPTLTRLLHTTGFDRIVTVADTVEAAAAALLDPVE
jgi:anti-sigma B factor antagonist